MDMYTVELFIKELDFRQTDKLVNIGNVTIHVTCTDILNYVMTPTSRKKFDIMHTVGNWGMVAIFPCDKKKIIADIGTNLKLTLKEHNKDELGTCFITFNSEFEKTIKKFVPESTSYYQMNETCKLKKNKRPVIDVLVQFTLMYFGHIIQLPREKMLPELNIPLPHRQGQKAKMTESDLWRPQGADLNALYKNVQYDNISPHLQKKFYPDSKYINDNLCDSRECPISKKFKELGLCSLTPIPKTTDKGCKRCFEKKTSNVGTKKCTCKNCKIPKNTQPQPEQVQDKHNCDNPAHTNKS